MSSQSPRDSAVTIAERLYQDTQGVFEANIVCTEPGIAAGMEFLDEKMPPAPAGSWYPLVANGDRLETGQALIKVFGGGVRPEQLQAVREADADTVDIGRAILDAPLLDLRMQIKNTQRTDDGATHEQESNTRKPVLTVYHNSTRS